MSRAHKVDAVNNELFYFRRFMAPLDLNDPEIARVVERANVLPSSPRAGKSSSSSSTTSSTATFGWDTSCGNIPVNVPPGGESQVNFLISFF